LKNNEFLAEADAANRLGKAANGKQLPLFAGIVKANPPNPLFQRGDFTPSLYNFLLDNKVQTAPPFEKGGLGGI